MITSICHSLLQYSKFVSSSHALVSILYRKKIANFLQRGHETTSTLTRKAVSSYQQFYICFLSLWPVSSQEPRTRSEQLPFARATAFSRTSIFLEQLWRKFTRSFKSHKPVNRPTDLKIVLFDLFMAFSFSITSYTPNALINWARFHLRRNKYI